MKDLDCICFGSIIVDYRKKLTMAQDITSKPLQLIDEPINLRIGGISILAIALQRMGFETGVAGQAGRDIIGYGITNYLRERYKINIEAIKFTPHLTSYSLINLTDKERYIQHNIGANVFLEPDREIMSFIKGNNPVLVAIGYSGLLPEMDRNNGAKMAEFINAVKSEGIKTAFDTHTMDKDYSMLDRPLREADVFFCNAEEGSGISGGKKLGDMLDYIIKTYLKDNDVGYRILGITLPNGVYIAYGKKGRFNKGFVRSHWYTDKPEDLTGAGDAFRAGFYAYLIRNIQSFKKGTFDWRKGGMLGNLTAATMVKEGFGGIKDYALMLKRCDLS